MAAAAARAPVLFLLCGLPFSGKTTLARKIIESTGSVLVGYDALWEEKHRETGRSLSWEELTDMAGERITEALAQGRSVVYDTLNDTRDNRDRLRRIAQVADADFIVVFTNTPLPLIRKRQQRNEVTRERHSVSTENFQEALDRFEAPDASAEFVLEFTPDDDFSVWREQLAFRHTTSSAAGDAP